MYSLSRASRISCSRITTQPQRSGTRLLLRLPTSLPSALLGDLGLPAPALPPVEEREEEDTPHQPCLHRAIVPRLRPAAKRPELTKSPETRAEPQHFIFLKDQKKKKKARPDQIPPQSLRGKAESCSKCLFIKLYVHVRLNPDRINSGIQLIQSIPPPSHYCCRPAQHRS